MTAAPAVRHARPADLPRVAELAAEHAVYEKAAPPVPDLAERLGARAKEKLRYSLPVQA